MQQQFGQGPGKWTTGSTVVQVQGTDQAPLQDQDSFMLSTQQLTSCLQPGLILAPNGAMQQLQWGTPTTQSLQDGSLMSLLPVHASTGMTTSMQSTALSGQQLSQPMQQVLVTASGEHMLVVSSDAGQGTMQPQQHVVANGTHTAAGDSEEALCSQIQQLQEAVQRLSCENTAVQQMILNAQASQPQDSGPLTRVLSLEGTSTSSPTALQPDTPVLAASLNSGSSPPGSFNGLDSMSSSWHRLDGLISNTSSPSVHGSSRLAQSGFHVPASHHMQGAPMVHVLTDPAAMHQQAPGMGLISISAHGGGPGAGACSMAHSQGGGNAAGHGQHGMIVFSQAGWTASGAPAYAPVAPGSLASNISFQQHHQQPAGYMSSQGPVMLVPAAAHNNNTQQQQQGWFAHGAAQGYVALPKPFRRNTPLKSRAAGQPAQRINTAAKPPLSADGAAAATPPAPSTRTFPAGRWADVSLQEGLKQLWSAEQLAQAKGGWLFNVQQLAWHPVGEPDPCAQDMYNFQKLKRMVQKLDAVHKTRVKLIKRLHAVADRGDCSLKSVYREVRALVGELLHDSAMQIKSLDECRVTGLVRLALMMQEALELGPPATADA